MAGYIGSKASVVSSGAERKTTITATSGQTSLTGLSYTPNQVHVFQNGVRLVDGTDYTATNGSSITLTVGASTDDQIVVVSYATFETSDTVSASAGGTFSGNIDVTGTVTSDGLTVDSDSTLLDFSRVGDAVTGKLKYVDADTGFHFGTTTNHDWYGISNDTKRLKIDNAGDISFYDTSGNAGLLWDASAASLGVGTTSPSSAIHAVGGAGTNIGIQSTAGSHWRLGDAVGASNGTFVIYDYTNSAVRLAVNSGGNVGIGTTSPAATLHSVANAGTTGLLVVGAASNNIASFYTSGNSQAVTFDSSGNVGIGTTSPSSYNGSADNLVVGSSGSNGITIVSGTSNSGNIFFADGTSGNTAYRGYVQYQHNTDALVLGANGDDRVYIASTGDLRVGKTSTMLADVGHELDSAGYAYITRDSGNPVYINRKTNDGNLIQFYKDTSNVGHIGTNGGKVFISGPDAGGIKFDQYGSTNGAPLPCNSSGAKADNVHDFGVSDARWDDIYATNGTIQTSDQNEKQNIETLTDAEITAAKAISKLFKTFKWKDKVAAKGDAARTHTGVIAQEVEAAMSDAGLDAGDYAFFINTTWWETSTEVAAVEADEENNIEAQDAYTNINTYYTSEEAPEGAVERNRKGIRYPELLSFIGAATEQRLTSIEARLDALET